MIRTNSRAETNNQNPTGCTGQFLLVFLGLVLGVLVFGLGGVVLRLRRVILGLRRVILGFDRGIFGLGGVILGFRRVVLRLGRVVLRLRHIVLRLGGILRWATLTGVRLPGTGLSILAAPQVAAEGQSENNHYREESFHSSPVLSFPIV